jgi:copper(I)-binding protein
MLRRVLILAGALAAMPALAQAPTIDVEQPWARATIGANGTGAVYLTLLNRGPADRLMEASTPTAGMAMIHQSYQEGGIEKMRMVDGVTLPSGKPVQLKPGGLHIMLTDLPTPLHRGANFPITLSFEKAPPVTVTVTVLAPGASGPTK